MKVIEIDGLVKRYKTNVKALDGLSLEVNSKEIYSLLGPNGAGKTSLINILTTYYKPTSGKVTILEKDLYKEPGSIRKEIACVAQNVSIDSHLSLRENMKFQSRLYKIDSKDAEKRINYLIDSFGLSKYLKYPTANYSGGVKRRLDIAMNMVSFPKILFLDEPTVGMDVESRKNMWEMMMKIRDEYETTIFLTTHYLEEADQLSDKICIIKEGKELIHGTPNSLRSYLRQNMIRVVFSNTKEIDKYKDTLNSFDFIKFVKVRNNSVFMGVANSRQAFISVNKWLLDHNIEFNAIEIVESTLEDVFLTLVRSEGNIKGE